MNNQISWRDKAIETISQALIEFEASHDVANLDSLSISHKVRKYLNDRYPFGDRDNLPFRVWKQEAKLGSDYFAYWLSDTDKSAEKKAHKYLEWRAREKEAAMESSFHAKVRREYGEIRLGC